MVVGRLEVLLLLEVEFGDGVTGEVRVGAVG